MNLIGVLILLALFFGGFAVAVFTKRMWMRWSSVALVAGIVLVAGGFLWQSNRWERGLGQIHIGDSRERVRQIMGAPTEITDASIGIYGSTRGVGNRVPGCTEQYWYYPFFTPECWWVAFDAQGLVLKTYHYSSP